MKKFLLLFGLSFIFSHQLMAQCPVGQWSVEVNIIPDDYPDETSWNLYVDNTEVANGTINNDTICADTTSCIQFVAHDAYGDGMCCGYGLGSYTVLIDGEVAVTGGEFTNVASHSMNCAEGTVCENPFFITEGNHVAPQPNSYYSFTPDSTGIYSITTCDLTTCDTYLWVYSGCEGIDLSGGNGGSLYNNDDSELCGQQASIEALMSAGNTYIIRVGLFEGATCDGGIPFSVTYQSAMTSVLPIVILSTVNDAINNDIKVPVDMKIIDHGPGELNAFNDSDFAYEGRILAELQGFTGPFYPKKNYDFDLIDELGNKIDASLLGLPAENDWIFKAEYLDNSLLINTVAYEFARRMGRYAPRTRQCEMFLDGQYIGVYTLTEKIKRDENRVDIANLSPTDVSGIDLTGGYIIEMNINGAPGAWNSAYPPINATTNDNPVEFKFVDPKATEIMPEQAEYIQNYVDSFEDAMDADTYLDPELGYRNWIDVSTFIDFLIVNEFTMNFDSYGRSTYMYKEKDTDGGLLCIGPAWDYDRAMAANPSEGWVWEITHTGWPFPFWWSKMYTDETYTHELACRWKSLRADVFTTSHFHEFIDSVASPLYQGPSQRNFSLWQTINPDAYQDQIQNMKNWLTDRLNWMDEALEPFGAALPVVNIPETLNGCVGLTYEAPVNPNWSYNWIPGPESPQMVFTEEGLYQLQVSDPFGCYTDQFLFADLSIPDATFEIQPEGNGYGFNFFAQNGVNSNYTWDFGDGSANEQGVAVNHLFGVVAEYVVTLDVVDSVGCTASSSQQVSVTQTNIGEVGEEMPWMIYPIPAGDYLVIECPEYIKHERYTIGFMNALGQELAVIPIIQEKTIIPFDKQHASGIYSIQMRNDQGQILSRKTIVKR